MLSSIAIHPASAPSDSPEWQREEWDSIEQLLQRGHEETGVPAIACVVIQDGSILHEAVVGVRVANGEDRATLDDAFHVGSITKSMTATVAGKLIEQGLIDWDDTLGELLDTVDIDLELGKRHFPRYTLPKEKDPDDYLREVCVMGLKDRYQGNEEMLPGGELSQVAQDRLDRELGVIQRLGFANSLIGDPEILILDEPTAGVDVELRHELWEFLKKINQEGVTILLTTHYIEEAEEMADRIGVINNGEIIVT